MRPRVSQLLWSFCFIALFGIFRPSPATAQFNGVDLKVADVTVPPGGTLQAQVFITEPKPIKGGKQHMGISGPDVTQVHGAALFSPDGDVCGIAVVAKGGTRVYFSSPLSSYGEDADTPVMVFTKGVSQNAHAGDTMKLSLDAKTAEWLDPEGNPYQLEENSGLMTVGGTLSVSDVEPGFGTVPAGTAITISGIGFAPDAEVDVNEAQVATTTYIDSTELQITLRSDFDLEGARVRVKNKSTNEQVEFFPFAQTAPAGSSSNPLIKASYPMFSHDMWTTAYFRPVVGGTQFAGLALQNLNANPAKMRIALYSSNGKLLGKKTANLPTMKRAARDLGEVFPGLVTTGTVVQVTSDEPIQVLGMEGDSSSGELLPVVPTAQ